MLTANLLAHVRLRLVARICVVWLSILTVLPFTAPFATLDVTDLFGQGANHPGVQMAPGVGHVQNDDADDAAASEAACRMQAASVRGPVTCAGHLMMVSVSTVRTTPTIPVPVALANASTQSVALRV